MPKDIVDRIESIESSQASETKKGLVKLSSLTDVTESDGLALPTRENNASINGTIANRISSLMPTVYYSKPEDNVADALSFTCRIWKIGMLGICFIQANNGYAKDPFEDQTVFFRFPDGLKHNGLIYEWLTGFRNNNTETAVIQIFVDNEKIILADNGQKCSAISGTFAYRIAQS